MQGLFQDEPEQTAARVLLDGFNDMVLDYAIPPGMSKVTRGSRVEVPLRNRTTTGTVIKLTPPDAEWGNRLKLITRLIDDTPAVGAKLMDLAEWAARYYAVPVEQLIRCIVPEPVRREHHEEKTRKMVVLVQWPGDEEMNKINAKAPRQAAILRYLHQSESKREPLADLGGSPALTPCRALEKRGFVRIEEEVVHRDPAAQENFAPSCPLKLNEEQQHALDIITQASDTQSTKPLVLQGVTGSGKTEVYLQAAAHVLQHGKGVLILVPEISLTPQTMARFKSRFAESDTKVAILHSAMSDGERFDEWHAIHRGKARIAIGPRSALFAPVQNLGLIIVDEEHDASYKQENSPRYHGRDLAVL
ncbi:MAG: DEAD/DEAH box helicase family protein, partial [Akkermansia sp.]|nr:DEAD/DEAH box helicase family protein [Akkermansia sp.]